MTSLPADEVIQDLASRLNAGLKNAEPVFITGSAWASTKFGTPFHDVDGFTPSPGALMTAAQSLLEQGYVMEVDHMRKWRRWRQVGMDKWHTNSLVLESPEGVETNLIYKTMYGHPLLTLSAVIETFDWGHLAGGYDVQFKKYRDMASYQFPDIGPDGPWPMMDMRTQAWLDGFFGKYQGDRQPGRLLKAHDQGHDMSLAMPTLATGYRAASSYYSKLFTDEELMRAAFYEKLADAIDSADWDAIRKFVKSLDDPKDLPLFQIMENVDK